VVASELETKELLDLLSQSNQTRSIEFEDKLGYRGFLIDLSDPKSQKTSRLKIFKNVIRIQSDGSVKFLVDNNREIERWLLKSGKSHLPLDRYHKLEEILEVQPTI
jgi:hypothetical protein